MLIHAFLHFLRNYTQIIFKKWLGFLGSLSNITSNSNKLLSLYIRILLMSDNMFNLILTMFVLYFVVKLQMYISIVMMVILNDNLFGKRPLAK